MNNKEVAQRAKILSENNNSIEECLSKNKLPNNVDVSLSEGLILALLKQGVRKYFAIFAVKLSV